MATPTFSLRLGCKGPATARLQKVLGVPPDGIFGSQTEGALRTEQARRGLLVDGICGTQTCQSFGLPIPVFGVDVSKWQGTVDWAAMAQDGVKVAAIRVSHGLGADTLGATNLQGAKTAGIQVLAYHYAKPDTSLEDATEEAYFAISQAGHNPLVLDLEEATGLTAAQVATWALRWLYTVRTRTPELGWPIVYANKDYIQRVFMAGTEEQRKLFSRFPLWLANPDGNGDGDLPPNDIWSDCAGVQFSWSGSVGGESPVDLNWWYKCASPCLPLA